MTHTIGIAIGAGVVVVFGSYVVARFVRRRVAARRFVRVFRADDQTVTVALDELVASGKVSIA